MTIEVVGAISSIVSSSVVVIGAFAALRQLRHLRASNEVSALQIIEESIERGDVLESMRFIQRELDDKLRDPGFVALLEQNPVAGEARAVLPALNFWERVGALVILGAVPARSIMLMYAWPILNTWNHAAPVLSMIRRSQDPGIGENFEHLAVLALRWQQDGHAREARNLLRMPAARPPAPDAP